MQGKTLYTILLSIIAVLTLALAVLIIVLFTFNAEKMPLQTNTNQLERIVPTKEQAEFKLFGYSEDSGGNKGAIFNIKSTAEHPNSFIMASISIIYDGGKKNKLLEERTDLIENIYVSQLKEATIEYFRSQSHEDLQSIDAMENARNTLKEIYNNIVSNNGTEDEFILKVVFVEWIIQ